jgi:hypothetical protein
MVKKFEHKDGTIEVTREKDNIVVNPTEKDGIIKVASNQSKESLLNEIEDKLNIMYDRSPAVVKEFIRWLEDVL